MVDEISGPKLFLRYAFPCAEYRLHASLISQQDFDTLKLLAETGDEPETVFLEKCFPNAVKDLGEHAKLRDITNMWATKTVAQLWRYLHGHNNHCAVKLLAVRGIRGQEIDVGLSFIVINLYNLDLRKGDLIFVHRHVVAEKRED